jgi:hypothetical protein
MSIKASNPVDAKEGCNKVALFCATFVPSNSPGCAKQRLSSLANAIVIASPLPFHEPCLP